MWVVDVCLGVGGKVLYLVVLMENKGQFILFDIVVWKLNEQCKCVCCNGIYIIEICFIENMKIIKCLCDFVDWFLLDVLCFGLGVLCCNLDLKWKFILDFVVNIWEMQ